MSWFLFAASSKGLWFFEEERVASVMRTATISPTFTFARLTFSGALHRLGLAVGQLQADLVRPSIDGHDFGGEAQGLHVSDARHRRHSEHLTATEPPPRLFGELAGFRDMAVSSTTVALTWSPALDLVEAGNFRAGLVAEKPAIFVFEFDPPLRGVNGNNRVSHRDRVEHEHASAAGDDVIGVGNIRRVHFR